MFFSNLVEVLIYPFLCACQGPWLFKKAKVCYTVDLQSAIKSAIKLLRHFTGIKLPFFGSTWCQKKRKNTINEDDACQCFCNRQVEPGRLGRLSSPPPSTFSELKKYRLTKKRVFSASSLNNVPHFF